MSNIVKYYFLKDKVIPLKIQIGFSNFLALIFTLNLFSCKKLVDIPAPVNSITTSEVFSTEDQAVSAISGLYFNLINTDQSFSSYSTTVYCGMSADELSLFRKGNVNGLQFEKNSLLATNLYINNNFWAQAYSAIYSANAIIEGLGNSSGVRDSVKKELIGEAKFIRAFCNFYLVNLFGGIPLLTTINWHKTNLMSRSTVDQAYEAIVNDLLEAQKMLAQDFSVGKNERIIPNKWAATALLARVYLYIGDWASSIIQSTSVINKSDLFALNSNLNNVFKVNNKEAIWQLQQNNSGTATDSYNATPEGYLLIPEDQTSDPPYAYLTDGLFNAFESGDNRKLKWVDSTVFSGNNQVYYIPSKYKVGVARAVPGGPYTEYYMILRLAELYLIRAEANAKQNKITEAISDINTIRTRAGLPPLPNTLSQTQVMAAIEQENRIEFFAEWGHRWLDLKRWGRADAVLGPIKGSNWQTTDQLYPIPQGELMTDPNLTQNPGY